MSQEPAIGPYKTGTGTLSRHRIYASGNVLIADFNTIEMMYMGSTSANAEYFANAGTHHKTLMAAIEDALRAIASNKDHPMTASEVILRDAFSKAGGRL